MPAPGDGANNDSGSRSGESRGGVGSRGNRSAVSGGGGLGNRGAGSRGSRSRASGSQESSHGNRASYPNRATPGAGYHNSFNQTLGNIAQGILAAVNPMARFAADQDRLGSFYGDLAETFGVELGPVPGNMPSRGGDSREGNEGIEIGSEPGNTHDELQQLLSMSLAERLQALRQENSALLDQLFTRDEEPGESPAATSQIISAPRDSLASAIMADPASRGRSAALLAMLERQQARK